MRDVIIGARFRGLKEMWIAAVLVTSGEAIEPPSQPAGPAGIASIALMRGLAEKFASVGVENALVSSGAIAANQHSPSRQGMTQCDVAQALVSSLARAA